ncbi:Scr1 family TA system antitoxin-like transcriptional regulator [Streptomyces parvus]|uniref:Scr1 family TA system antitoxin-like transcriptional regulator n=1 Tax=Streptomyces parvus TaxID=66428 RepID=UPI001945B7A4
MAQLDKILEMNNSPKLTIQVVPFSQGWHAGADGAFNVYSYPDPMDLDVVNLEYLDGALYLEEDESVERYQLAFDELRAAALTSRQSMELISAVKREFVNRA